MKKINTSLILLLCTLLMVILSGCAADDTEAAPPPADLNSTTSYINTETFLSSQVFAKSLSEAKLLPIPLSLPDFPQIAVVPHHDVAAALTAQCIAQLPQDTKTVIVLGPNHQNTGKQIMTTAASFKSVAGTVENATEITSNLVEQGILSYADDEFNTEHSIGMLIPYIAHFLPDAQIVPIICHHSLTLEQGLSLISTLSPYINEHTVLIGSIDFSHGLKADAAMQHNEQILDCIYGKMPSVIAKMDSTYLDSPGILATLVQYADQLALSPNLIAESNAEIILKTKQDDVTSYLTLLY